MTALVPGLLLLAALGQDLSAVPGHTGGTACVQCHTPDGWKRVSFDHDRTGFHLTGAHRTAACQGCHRGAMDAGVPRMCGACHRDPHRGELGARCEGCHETASWASTFGADAHRRTAFPLTGRHAFIPCRECHPDTRDRGFVGNAVTCDRCHAGDRQRASAGGVNHARLGFTQPCLTCHDAWSFERGTWPAHDACFGITAGPHAGITCLGCHRSLSGATPDHRCSTNTAACTRCHGGVRDQHRGVAGFQLKDRKCYECHRFSSAKLRKAWGGRR